MDSSAKKTSKSKNRDFYCAKKEKYPDLQSKRILLTASIKNSTRFSENYSNINTSNLKKKVAVSSSRNIHKQNLKDLKNSSNSNYPKLNSG
jgi:hypothetical protein